LVKRWDGKLLWGTDCSYVNLPDTAETREAYTVQTNQHDEEGVVQALASVVYDLENDLVIHGVISSKRAEKEAIFQDHRGYYQEDVVNVLDRGYCDYSVIAFHA